MCIVCAAVILLSIAAVNAVVFYFIIGGAVKLKDAFRLTGIATSVNKIIFSGSGYLLSSYLSREKKLSFSRTIGAFFMLEFLSVSLWLVLGLYFGAKLAIRIPWIILVAAIIVFITVWFRGKRVVETARSLLRYFKVIKNRIIFIMPFIILNMALVVIYYFVLFKFFNLCFSFIKILKIVSISFSTGYLSFAPAGLGFKDTALVFLLAEEGVTWRMALSIAVIDRVIVTLFWGLLGLVLGFDSVKKEIVKRLGRH